VCLSTYEDGTQPVENVAFVYVYTSSLHHFRLGDNAHMSTRLY